MGSELCNWQSTSVFSSNDIRAELGDINDQSKNKKVFDILYSRLAEALKTSNVVMDATNYSEQSRLSLESVAKQAGAEIHWKYFNSSLQQCFENNKKRDRFVPENVIRKQWTTLTLPYDNVEFMYVPKEDYITQCCFQVAEGNF